jgi:hypothetical protein
MYLAKAEKQDDQITKNWFEDTGGVLVFVSSKKCYIYVPCLTNTLKNGLLSAIVATFLTLSVPQLMPDSGSQTVALLTQLVNVSSGSPIIVQDTPPFQPPASIVRANVLWFLSLILSLGCALLTTSMQQSARVYLDYAQHRSAPRKQARVREYMFKGVEEFRLSQAVGTMPFLLHISVFLFFAGLIEFLLPINSVVGSSALGCIALCVFLYAVLTLLAILRPNCPYRTPLSGFAYFLFHCSAFSLFVTADTIEGIFHGSLLKTWRWFYPDVRRSPNDWPTKWKEVLEQKVLTHYERFLRGLQWRVMLSAMEAPSSVDASALRWILTTLDDNQKFEEFAAHMPGFFYSTATPDATSAMLSLMSEQPTADLILGSRLRQLLNTCLPGSSLLTEVQRKGRLRVCLMGLWHCLRAFNFPENLEMPLPPYVRAVFASPQVIRWIQSEKDFAVRLLGRCFGSLVVKKLANDITSAARLPTTAEMTCFESILGATDDQVWAWLDHKGAIDLANVTLLASAELETLVNSGTRGVPADVGDVFQQTLRILGEGVFSSGAKVKWDTRQVVQFHKIYSKLKYAPITDMLIERLRFILDRLPPYMEEPEMGMPSLEKKSGDSPNSLTVPESIREPGTDWRSCWRCTRSWFR